MSGIINITDDSLHVERHIAHYRQNPNATTVGIDGTTNTATQFGATLTLVQDTTGEYINYLSANPSGSNWGIRTTNFTELSGATSPVWMCSGKTGASASDLTNLRMWIGMCNSNPIGSDNPGVIPMAMFRYATGVDGTAFWRTVTDDGASSTITTTTVAVAINTRYEFRIEWLRAGSIDFFINQQLVASHTTNLPSATALMGWLYEGGSTANGTKNWLWHRTAYEQG